MTLRVFHWYERALQATVLLLLGVSGLGILTMMGVTCADIVLRIFDRPIRGALDIVSIASALTIVCGLPYTTAVKGHVAIEYFFHQLPWKGRIAVDTLVRLGGIALFALLAWQSGRYGISLKAVGRVSSTLQIPLFWVAWTVGISCGCVALVVFQNLIHPGREMIKP
ncbi:TRAP transporter small permease [bacterium]|nr:TRAP transporter small permease [bacterium]